ncbi:PucR family transcriptional regulator [Spongisporangium articulatum]|uniref:PucR family transcriptional regulator n=1 Tax=Spongisporangium articulatum TaxID=3362603 RepID=A0ABW8AWH2_9ACTN
MIRAEEPTAEQVRQEVGALIQAGAKVALSRLDDELARIATVHLDAPGMERVAADPVLAESSVRAIRATLAHWTASVINQPFAPVGPPEDWDNVRIARDLVRRGLDETVLVAYRVVQAFVWQEWIRIAFTLSDDPAVVQGVLEHTSASITDFAERSLQHIGEIMAAEREHLRRGSRPERRETVALLLDGAPVTEERASARLGLRLDRPHTAVVIWVDDTTPPAHALEPVIDLILQVTEARQYVSVLPQTGLAWMWVSGRGPDVRELEGRLRQWPDIHVAIGTTGTGVEGFRSSHRSAVAVQRLLSRSRLRQVASADDARLAALLSRHRDDATAYAREVLGDLADAGPEILGTVRLFVQELGNVKGVAERLFTHRNTVVRRLARADELLPRPLRSNPVEVAVALEIWQWSTDPGGSDAG